MKIVQLADHPKVRARKTRETEMEWLKRYHAAHDGARDLSEKEFELLHAGMHWLLRSKVAASLQDAYEKALSGLER